MQDPHLEIARLERDLETLAEADARCRKLDAGGRLALAGGALWLAAVFLGLARGDTAPTLLAITALIGGIVLYGSNRASWARVTQRRAAAETRRAQLIDGLDMRTVREPSPPRRLH